MVYNIFSFPHVWYFFLPLKLTFSLVWCTPQSNHCTFNQSRPLHSYHFVDYANWDSFCMRWCTDLTVLTSSLTTPLSIQPKNILRKRLHKRRRAIHPLHTSYLTFGDVGINLLRPFQMTTKQLGRFVLILKKTARKRDKTNRIFWVRLFPNFPLTRKVLNSRMGKGKGKYKCWSLRIAGNATIVELERIKFGRFLYLMKQIRARTTTLVCPIFQSPVRIPLFVLATGSRVKL